MEKHITRRDFWKIAGTFGLTSTLFAWSSLCKDGSFFSSEALAATASENQKKRNKKNARFNLKFGAGPFTKEKLNLLPNGSLAFVSDLEDRTDGEIRIEFLGGGEVCTEVTCAKLCLQGQTDFFCASTQNSSATLPYLNVLDFAYLWHSRASLYHFFFHPKSEPLLREPVRKFHKMQFLFTHCELRGIMMGLKYKDKPNITSVEGLKDAKLRVTATQLGRIALKLMGTNPVPIPYKDTLKSLETGLIDGAETWSSAAVFGDWGPVLSQDVRCGFLAGTSHTSMNLASFEKLNSELQGAVMESAYLTQINVQKTSESKLISVTGITDPPLPGSYYHKHGIRNCIWTQEELKKAEKMASPKYNPEPWQEWRERLNHLAGGIDIFEELYKIAREVSPDLSALDVEPRRWWKR